jgi:hypothetical protein
MKRECFSLVALVQSLRTLRSLALQVRFFLPFAVGQEAPPMLYPRLQLLSLPVRLLRALAASRGVGCRERQKRSPRGLRLRQRSRLLGLVLLKRLAACSAVECRTLSQASPEELLAKLRSKRPEADPLLKLGEFKGSTWRALLKGLKAT